MENFICDLPLPVNFEQSEEVGKAMGNVLEIFAKAQILSQCEDAEK